MSVQSESGRIDYAQSDHAPKGTRMAGDVVTHPASNNPDSYYAAKKGQESNIKNMMREAPKPVGGSTIDTTNIRILRP